MGSKSKRRRPYQPPQQTPQAISRIEPKPKSGSITEVTQTRYSGPIPDPQWLEQYDRIHPGLANRIVSMAESEASHRRGIENDAVAAQIYDAKQERRQQRRGQWMAFVVAVLVTTAGTSVALFGHPWPGSLLGGLRYRSSRSISRPKAYE